MKKYEGIELVEKLCALFGPSGFEDEVAEFIAEQIKDVCDSLSKDRLGNVIAKISCNKPESKKLMLSAHMDEVGFMVNEITDDGYLKFDTLGGIDRSVLCGKTVTIGDETKKINGIITSVAIHHKKKDERLNLTPLKSMYIDIGASTKDEAKQEADVGSFGTFASEFVRFGKGDCKIKGKAIDDRLGCAVMIETARAAYINRESLTADLYLCFTVREEIGLSGARVAAQTLCPDFAIVLETTAVADIAGVPENSRVAIQGKGGAISLMDRSTIYDREFVDEALRVAKKADIPVQIKKYVSGGNDASHIHKSGVGVRTLALSAPTRYLHSPACVVDVNDYFSIVSLVKELVKSDFFANDERN